MHAPTATGRPSGNVAHQQRSQGVACPWEVRGHVLGSVDRRGCARCRVHQPSHQVIRRTRRAARPHGSPQGLFVRRCASGSCAAHSSPGGERAKAGRSTRAGLRFQTGAFGHRARWCMRARGKQQSAAPRGRAAADRHGSAKVPDAEGVRGRRGSPWDWPRGILSCPGRGRVSARRLLRCAARWAS